jgi:SagB-type dehydrogenase family enzyme
MPDLKKTSAMQYLQATKFYRRDMNKLPRPQIKPADVAKRLPDTQPIILPRSWKTDGDSLWQVLQHRRSRRKFDEIPLSLQDLAALLWAAQGITGQAGRYFLRTSPSAGALYPIETYVAAVGVSGVEPGLYHFNVEDFLLETVRVDRDIGQKVANAALNQSFLARGKAVFILAAVFRRTMVKYGNRGGRYIWMDAAHICQNILLAAESLKRPACPVAAFYDEELNALLDLDGTEESTIYLAVVG